MTQNTLYRCSAVELAVRIRHGTVSPIDVVTAHLDRIDDVDGEINAFVSVFDEEARDRAREAERAVEAGVDLGPLHGVPVAIKDLGYLVEGRAVTSGVKPLVDNVADRDSLAVTRLYDAGAIILGQTNTPEFGYKGATDNMWFGPTSTPFDTDRNAGGSSGGSAAAVASGMVPVALGGDGGGSVRIPASCTGTYGFKPTFGRIPRASRPIAFLRHTPFADPGPITRTVEDAALVLSVLARPHTRDPFSQPDDGTEYERGVHESIDGVTIGYSPDFGGFPVEDRVETIVADAVGAFERKGATVEPIRIDAPVPHSRITELWLDAAGTVYATVEEQLRRSGEIDLLGSHREELPADFIEVVERGRSLDAVELGCQGAQRTELLDSLEDTLDRVDLLVTPTISVPPFENAAEGLTAGPDTVDGEPVDPRIGWCLTHPINFTGHPAASIPAGFTDDGLPVGMQVIGAKFGDDLLLAACAAFERVRPWQDSYPEL